MKIGIITFHAAFNYGSMLQAYALQTYLERLGHEVSIINFRPKSQKLGYPKPIEFSSLNHAKQSIRRLLFAPLSIKPLNHKWILFDKFMHKYLHLTKEFHSLDEMKDEDYNYDVLITGSDQIWNTNAFDFSEAYFGTFVDSKIKKIAYAPSMGPNPEGLDKNYLKKLLTGYTAVSVRERRTKDFLERNGIYKNVSLVLDPTMLLDDRDYDSLIDKEPIIKGNYLFYYTPGRIRPEFLKEALYIGNKLGLPVVYDNYYYKKDIKDYCNIYAYPETGPSEFLNLVKNATAVCGASFHLMVFSILFKKNFYCMNGDVDSRMNNLMVSMGLEDRIWSIIDKERNNLAEAIYSDLFNDNIDKQRKQSSAFLSKSLASRF